MTLRKTHVPLNKVDRTGGICILLGWVSFITISSCKILPFSALCERLLTEQKYQNANTWLKPSACTEVVVTVARLPPATTYNYSGVGRIGWIWNSGKENRKIGGSKMGWNVNIVLWCVVDHVYVLKSTKLWYVRTILSIYLILGHFSKQNVGKWFIKEPIVITHLHQTIQ